MTVEKERNRAKFMNLNRKGGKSPRRQSVVLLGVALLVGAVTSGCSTNRPQAETTPRNEFVAGEQGGTVVSVRELPKSARFQVLGFRMKPNERFVFQQCKNFECTEANLVKSFQADDFEKSPMWEVELIEDGRVYFWLATFDADANMKSVSMKSPPALLGNGVIMKFATEEIFTVRLLQ